MVSIVSGAGKPGKEWERALTLVVADREAG
jgi:hypothetical protein